MPNSRKGVGHGFRVTMTDIQTEKAEVQAIFRKTNEDQRRAYCEEDLDLDDIAATELTDRQRVMLEGLLLSWGRRVGVIDND